MKDLGKLIVSIVGCELVGLSATPFTIPAISSWYRLLNKPSFSPPNYLFGPVWTLLYFLMGISLYLIWKEKRSKKSSEAIKLFLLQLTLNFLWSLIFFGSHQIGLAFLDILLLLGVLFVTFRKFSQLNKLAGYLLIPYLLWTTFASVLNLSFLVLN